MRHQPGPDISNIFRTRRFWRADLPRINRCMHHSPSLHSRQTLSSSYFSTQRGKESYARPDEIGQSNWEIIARSCMICVLTPSPACTRYHIRSKGETYIGAAGPIYSDFVNKLKRHGMIWVSKKVQDYVFIRRPNFKRVSHDKWGGNFEG